MACACERERERKRKVSAKGMQRVRRSTVGRVRDQSAKGERRRRAHLLPKCGDAAVSRLGDDESLDTRSDSASTPVARDRLDHRDQSAVLAGSLVSHGAEMKCESWRSVRVKFRNRCDRHRYTHSWQPPQLSIEVLVSMHSVKIERKRGQRSVAAWEGRRERECAVTHRTLRSFVPRCR